MKLNWSYSPETPNSVQNRWFKVPCELEFDGWPWKTTRHLFYVTSSCVRHFVAISKSNGVTVQKRRIRVKIYDFMSHVTLRFDEWHCKTIRHLVSARSSFCASFVAIGEFKLELRSGNARFGSKSTFLSSATFKFDRWPWKTTRQLFYSTSSYVHQFVAISKFKLELWSGNV